MTNHVDFLDIDALQENFTWACFQRIDPATNTRRYYAIGWQPTLYHTGAVVRVYGRIGKSKRIMSPMEFDSLDEAWPTIHSLIERRLKRGYRMIDDLAEVEPVIRVTFSSTASEIVPMEQLNLAGIDT